MTTPILTLFRRLQYRGGRKHRSAWRKLGQYRMSELYAAGIEFRLVPKSI